MLPFAGRALSRLRQIKRKWLALLLIPSGIVGSIVAVPLLLLAMLIGSRALAIMAGPVNIWNTTWRTPQDSEIAGNYGLAEGNVSRQLPTGAFISGQSGFRLGADHQMEMIEVPAFDGVGNRFP